MTAALTQPRPDEVSTPEQALAVFALDPDLHNRESAWCWGFVEGAVAGAQYAFRPTLDDEFAGWIVEAYQHQPRLVPLPFAEALAYQCRWHLFRDGVSGGWRPEQMRLIGRLYGWLVSTAGAAGATECAACSRRLIDGLDDIAWCEARSEHLCADECHQTSCSAPVCWAD